MIRRYVGRRARDPERRDLLLAVKEDCRYVLDHFDEMVVKSRSGWGGKTSSSPRKSPKKSSGVSQDGRRQPDRVRRPRLIDFSTHVLCSVEDGEMTLRDSYADYRVLVFVSDPETVEIVPGAMTRVASPAAAWSTSPARCHERHLGLS